MCTVTPGERIMRIAVAVFVGAFAVSMGANLWCAIPAGVCAVLLAIGAVTGWCPALPHRELAMAPNDLGIPEARQNIDI